MKKLALTIAIVLGLSMTTFADGGGLFQRGKTAGEESGYMNGNRNGGGPALPPGHGLPGNQDGDTPLGAGIAVLAVLGGAYLVGKKRREE